MIPNWLLGKSKSKLQEILGGGGGGGTTYTAGEGIDIANDKISVDPLLMNDIEQTALAIHTKAALTQITNPNLLDNPWFTVNQRGQSSYGDASTTGSIFTVDRWKRNTYNENGHKFTVGSIEIPYIKGDFYQTIESATNHWRHVPYTVSAIIDGNLYSKTFTPYDDEQIHMGSSAWGSTSIGLDGLIWNIIENWSSSAHLIGINNKNASQDHVISAIKLERGEVSTLAMDTAPNYATELAKCQRYFQRISKDKINDCWFGLGVVLTQKTQAEGTIIIPAPMRADARATVHGTFNLWDGAVSQNVTSLNIGLGSGVTKHWAATVANDFAGATVALYASSNVDCYIDFDAEL